MQTIYSVKVRFATVAPLFCDRTYFVATAQAVEELKRLAETTGYIFLGFSIQHVMDRKEVVQDMVREIGECKRAAGEA